MGVVCCGDGGELRALGITQGVDAVPLADDGFLQASAGVSTQIAPHLWLTRTRAVVPSRSQLGSSRPPAAGPPLASGPHSEGLVPDPIRVATLARPVSDRLYRFMKELSSSYKPPEFVAYDAHEVEVQRDNPYLFAAPRCSA